MAGVKSATRTAWEILQGFSYRLLNLLTAHTPVQLVVCGPDDELAKHLTDSIARWYHPHHAVTVWAPAVSARTLRSRVIVSWDPDDAGRLERIVRKLSPTRKLVFVCAVAHPHALASERSSALTHHFYQGADYRLFVDGATRSMTRPGIVDRSQDVVNVAGHYPDATLIVRREDLHSDSGKVIQSVIDAVSRQGGPKPHVAPHTIGVPPIHQDPKRVTTQRARFPELDQCAAKLGYAVATLTPPPALVVPRGMIIAFHTPDEIYRTEAERLKGSLDRLGLEYSVTVVEPESNWVRTTLLKPTWIKPARQELRGPLLYIDVDAFVHEDPWPHCQELDADMAAVVYPSGELNSATLWINDTPEALVLLDRWASWSTNRRASDDGSLRQIGDDSDQGVLRQIVEAEERAADPAFRFARLTPNLASIFDRQDDYRFGPVAIEQLQASREITQREKRLARRRDRLAELGQ
jgi:hypothetical protein